jgi:hypothetical protein
LKAKGKRQKAKVRTGSRLTSLIYFLLTFAFCLLPFAFLSGCALRASRAGIPPPAQAAIDTVSNDISEGRFEKIYNEAADEWQQAKTLEQSNEILKQLKEKLGDVKGRAFHTATEEDKPSAHTFTITYKTTFDRGVGMETFTLVERKGQWLLAGYFVNSDALK